MLKNMFFKALALLCPKNSDASVKTTALKKALNGDKNAVKQVKVNTEHNFRLLVELSKSEIRLQYLKKKCMEQSLMVVFLALVSLNAHSQVATPLNIGVKMPQAVLNKSFPVFDNRQLLTDSIKLKDYSDKIILLDFWAAWCSTCIYKFPLLEALQKQYAKDLVVVLVNAKRNKDTPERIQGILSGAKAPYIKTNLFTIYNDTLLTKVFPHSYLPHYAWIGKDGTLKLLSSAEMLNAATLDALLSNLPLTPSKK